MLNARMGVGHTGVAIKRSSCADRGTVWRCGGLFGLRTVFPKNIYPGPVLDNVLFWTTFPKRLFITFMNLRESEESVVGLAAAFAGLWRLPCCLRGGVTTGDAYLFDRLGGFGGGVSLDEPLLPASSLT